MTFRLNAKAFFLTYPQCPIPKEIAKILLEDRGTIIEGIFAEEKHEDGTPHLHAYIKFDRKRNFTNNTCFDLLYEGKNYHGNYQTARNPEASKQYCKKDGNFIETTTGEEEDLFSCARRMTREEFIKECMERKIQHAYMNEIWNMTRDINTLNNEAAGTTLLNKEQFTMEDLKDLDTILNYRQYLKAKKKTKAKLQEIVTSNQSLSLDRQEQEKQLGRSTTFQNRSCSAHTWTPLDNTTPLYTSPCSLTTCPFSTYQENLKSVWLTENNQEQFIADTQQSVCPEDWLNVLRQIDTHSPLATQQLKEDLNLLV